MSCHLSKYVIRRIVDCIKCSHWFTYVTQGENNPPTTKIHLKSLSYFAIKYGGSTHHNGNKMHVHFLSVFTTQHGAPTYGSCKHFYLHCIYNEMIYPPRTHPPY